MSLVEEIFLTIGLILFLIIALISVIIIFYYVIREVFLNKNKINEADEFFKKYGTWSVEQIQNRITLVNQFVVFEFFCLLVILLVLVHWNYIDLSPNMLQIQNIKGLFYDTVSYNLTCPNSTCLLSSSQSFSVEKFSVVIALLTGFVIYTYFFEMVGDVRSSNKIDETQKKYFGVFGNLWIFTAIYTLFIIILDIITGDFDVVKQIIPLVIGWINIFVAFPLPFCYPKKIESYELLEKFNKSSTANNDNSTSLIIFISTLLIAYIGYSLDFDIFLLIFLEITFLLIHLWIHKYRNLPHEKCTIILNNTQDSLEKSKILENVYIINELEDSFTIVSSKEANVQKTIMKSTVNQIIINKSQNSDTAVEAQK